MDQADLYRYSQRNEIDKQINAMRNRIIEERRGEIGRMAAHQEAIAVTTDWYRAQYMRIEHEVIARWGADA
jgi:uncharacterized membrane protein